MFVQRKGKLYDRGSRKEDGCRVSADFTGGGCSQIFTPSASLQIIDCMNVFAA